MRRRRFTEEQIVAILRRAEAGQRVVEVCRDAGITDGTFYRWKAKYGGLEASELRRIKQLEEENRRLKQIVAEQALDIVVLKDVASKKW